jgi:hypothetical protein
VQLQLGDRLPLSDCMERSSPLIVSVRGSGCPAALARPSAAPLMLLRLQDPRAWLAPSLHRQTRHSARHRASPAIRPTAGSADACNHDRAVGAGVVPSGSARREPSVPIRRHVRPRGDSCLAGHTLPRQPRDGLVTIS